jgi:hypothetical protein
MKNQKGFSAVEGLLILVIVGLLGFVGWYVWSTGNKTRDNLDKAAKSSVNSDNQKDNDLTKGWKEYVTEEGGFSLRYPGTWFTGANADLCEDNIFLLGPTKETAGVCATDGMSQMIFLSYVVESGPAGLSGEAYENIKIDKATADGVSGDRYSGTYKGDPEGTLVGGNEKGMKAVIYHFETKGKHYKASYFQESKHQDVLKEFDLIVTKTLKFSN